MLTESNIVLTAYQELTRGHLGLLKCLKELNKAYLVNLVTPDQLMLTEAH